MERGQAHVIASGSLLQQASQVTGLLAMLAIITVLGRRLSLSEFGVYGLLSSLAGYLLVVQNSAASAGVRTMAAALEPEERAGAFSTAAAVYAVAGALTGLLVAGVGVVLALTVDLSAALQTQAVLGALLLGAVTAIGWPITVYRDALRASQQFIVAASIEIVSMLVYCGLMLALVFGGAELAVLIAASGTIPLLAGAGCALAANRRRLPYRFRRDSITGDRLRRFASLAFYVSLSEAAATIVYAFDRAILGLFKSAATVGLYEGPVRVHNMVRALNAAVTVTTLPTASRYVAAGDRQRLRELLVRGARYTLALTVPLTVTGMVLAPLILDVWLGSEFRTAGTAMAILMSYWLVNGSTGVISGILIAAGHAPWLARYAWVVALSNLVLSLALTPPLGLEGVVLGTTIPYFVAFPVIFRFAMREVEVDFATVAREVFVPVYALGGALALALGLARLTLPLDTLPAVLAAAAAGPLAAWGAFYAFWLRPGERRLVRDVAGGFLRLAP